jgi:hypothetical protein
MENKRFLESRIELEKYIGEQLRQIKDGEEYRQLKNMSDYLIMPLYDHLERQYLSLEQRIEEQLYSDKNQITIVTGLEKKSRYQIHNEQMFPINPDDLATQEVVLSNLNHAEEKSVFLFTIFLKADYATVRRFEQQHFFHGYLQSGNNRLHSLFEVRRNDSYCKTLEELRESFLLNGQEYETVCAPYLYKLFDVYLVKEMDYEEEITEIEVDFEHFKTMVEFDVLPIWNIKYIEAKSSGYPQPCKDHIHYEHGVSGIELGKGYNYLLADTREKQVIIRQEIDNITLICDLDKPQSWTFFCITPVKDYASEYPLMTNERMQDMNLMHEQSHRVRTKAEVFRYVQTFGYQEFVKLLRVEAGSKNYPKSQVYSMNLAKNEELDPPTRQNDLWLIFSAEKQDYLTYDIISYLVSRLQREYTEFCCYGILIEDAIETSKRE